MKVATLTMAALALHGAAAFHLCGQTRSSSSDNADWPAYGGSGEEIRYSKLAQITRANVSGLSVAWTFKTPGGTGATQTQPIVINGVLFSLTPTHKVIALEAGTGKQVWMFDSGLVGRGPNRGVVYWSEGNDRRIFSAVQSFVYALNADTGRPITAFGDNGRIDLRQDLGREPDKQSIVLTSPGVIYQDLLIVGGRTPESLPSPPGDIRAYDVRTGKMRWSFHTIPHPGEYGYRTWPKDAWTYTGSANNWPGMAVDAGRGIVYVPTGSAATDFYGADRIGNDLFADCLLALNARTGKRIWHFQFVHHDIWDRDPPSPPNLVTVTRNGKRIDAVSQTTKQGWVYLFDRVTGKPLFPMVTRSYPPSTVPGEIASKMQSLPTKPAPYSRQFLTEDLLSARTPEVHRWAISQFRNFRSEGQFIPFGITQQTVIFPGFDGGAEWGGAAFDPQTSLLYVNANDMAWTASLTKNKGKNSGRQIYLNNCGACHGENLAGAPPQIPSLVGVGSRRDPGQIATIIHQGAGRMPSFPNLSETEISGLIEYLTSGEDKELASKGPSPINQEYRFTGYHRFVDEGGYPAVAPPWGTLNAIDLSTGEYAWKIPLGEYPELVSQGVKNTGTENYGGPIVTAGGLVFIGATNYDRKFRAFDKETGKLLWEAELPKAGNATPITYEVNGRQYVVIYATGGYDRRPKAQMSAAHAPESAYVAFSLPN